MVKLMAALPKHDQQHHFGSEIQFFSQCINFAQYNNTTFLITQCTV